MKIKMDVSTSLSFKLLYICLSLTPSRPGGAKYRKGKKIGKKHYVPGMWSVFKNDLKCQNTTENKNHAVQDFTNDFLGKIEGSDSVMLRLSFISVQIYTQLFCELLVYLQVREHSK